MFLVSIGIYTLFLAIVWGFFIVIKIHAFKFKNFSDHIIKVTYALFTFLAILSILGYIIIFLSDLSSSSFKLDFKNKNISDYDHSEY